MAKQPTPQGISALLKKAGFTRSKSSPSRIRGMQEHSEGYQVSKYSDDAVLVKHAPGFARGVAAQVRQHDKLTSYKGAIEAAGFDAQIDQYGYSVAVIVKAAREES